MITANIGAAASIDFVVGMMVLADDEYRLPVTRPQGGTKLDDTFPDGAGRPSEDEPILPSRQPVVISSDFPRKRK
jgi:hypothetical protein